MKRSFSILLAEDIQENALLATIRLEQTGHRVMSVANGLEAVEAVGKNRFDIILMDIHMPEMDGLEATRLIRQSEEGENHIPVVALTASVMNRETEKYKEAGMDSVVSKPINFDELFLLMDRIIPEENGETDSIQENTNATTIEVPGSIKLKGIDTEKGLSGWKDWSLYKKALKSFYRRYENFSEQLKDSQRRGDRDEVYQLIHSLKGLSGNLAMTGLYDAVILLENEILSEEDASKDEHTEAMIYRIEEVLDSIRGLENSINDSTTEETDEHISLRDRAESITNLENMFRMGNYDEKLLNSLKNSLKAEIPASLLESLSESAEQFDFNHSCEIIGKIKGIINNREL